MKPIYPVVLASILLLGTACAQEYPSAEIGIDYSYARFGPSFPNSRGHSLNGGGGWAVYNMKPYAGIKMELQGYGSNQTGFLMPPSTNFPVGAKGNIQGDLLTYLFGPQVKIRAYQLQPYFHLLFGGAHTNVYVNAFKSACQGGTACTFSKAPTTDAFAMAFGGGIDVPITKYIQFRPAEIDYLLTRFSNQFTKTNNQNTFRYCAGLNFTFGNAY